MGLRGRWHVRARRERQLFQRRDQLAALADAETFIDAAEMIPDGVLGDPEARGDRLVRQSHQRRVDQLPLPISELRQVDGRLRHSLGGEKQRVRTGAIRLSEARGRTGWSRAKPEKLI